RNDGLHLACQFVNRFDGTTSTCLRSRLGADHSFHLPRSSDRNRVAAAPRRNALCLPREPSEPYGYSCRACGTSAFVPVCRKERTVSDSVPWLASAPVRAYTCRSKESARCRQSLSQRGKPASGGDF